MKLVHLSQCRDPVIFACHVGFSGQDRMLGGWGSETQESIQQMLREAMDKATGGIQQQLVAAWENEDELAPHPGNLSIRVDARILHVRVPCTVLSVYIYLIPGSCLES